MPQINNTTSNMQSQDERKVGARSPFHALRAAAICSPSHQDFGQGFLIFGGSGWLGGLLTAMLKEQGEVVNLATARLEDRAAIQRDLLQYKPKYVLNVAGMVRCANLFIMSQTDVDSATILDRQAQRGLVRG